MILNELLTANHSTNYQNLAWSGVNEMKQEMYIKTHKKFW